MIRTIVNADDFGISKEVNEAIRESFEKRIITNTTLMVNMPYAGEAVELAREQGFSERVGLHLNLTAGKPLTKKITRFPMFCDRDGNFNAKFHLSTSTRLHIGKKASQAVREEIEAQICRYLSYGLPEKHLDSHHHVHTDLSIFKQARPIIQSYGFRSVRISRNMYDTTTWFNAQYKRYYNKEIRKMDMVSADYFGSFKDYTAYRGKLPDNSLVEIMLHPMYSDSGELMDTKTPMAQVKSVLEEKNRMAQAY